MAKSVKQMFQSKTVWGGFFLALAGLFTGIAQILLGEIDMEMFLMSVGVFLKGCWDIYNRFQTTEPITFK
jgi:hypothetical protein